MYQCISNPTYDDFIQYGQPQGCGSRISAVGFIFTFVLFVSLIFLNLFIAIILQGFDETSQREKTQFNSDTMDNFREVWSRFDPDATTFIKTSELPELLL